MPFQLQMRFVVPASAGHVGLSSHWKTSGYTTRAVHGYQLMKAALKGKANYHRIEGNGGPSDQGAANMDLWLGDYAQKGFHWDVLQFNFGLHDLKQGSDKATNAYEKHLTEIEDYKNNLEKIIVTLEEDGRTRDLVLHNAGPQRFAWQIRPAKG